MCCHAISNRGFGGEMTEKQRHENDGPWKMMETLPGVKTLRFQPLVFGCIHHLFQLPLWDLCMPHIFYQKMVEASSKFSENPASVCQWGRYDTSWWFQPIWKILVKLDDFPKYRDENHKYLKPPPRISLAIHWLTENISYRIVVKPTYVTRGQT